MTTPVSALRQRLTEELPDFTPSEVDVLIYLYKHRRATVARLSKEVELGQAQLRRALAMLGSDIGVGMVEQDDDHVGRVRLSITGITFLEISAG